MTSQQSSNLTDVSTVNNVMTSQQFTSIDKFHSFGITILEDTAYFALRSVEPSQYKTFLLLLKRGFEYMKQNNVKYVKQQINVEDKESFKKSNVIEENNVLIVKTNIDDFLFEICDAIGMHRL
jgi:hypothetical protein